MTNQHIFITGGASGIGAAAVRLFSNRGWNRITTTITTMMLMLFSYGIKVGGLSGGLSFWYNPFPLLMTYIPAVARAPAMIYFQ